MIDPRLQEIILDDQSTEEEKLEKIKKRISRHPDIFTAKEPRTKISATAREVNSILSLAIKEGYTQIVAELLKHPGINLGRGSSHASPLIRAINSTQASRNDMISRIINHPSVKPNQRETNGYSPLQRALKKDDLTTVHKLLAHPETEVNLQTYIKHIEKNQTALDIAIENSNTACIRILLVYGAKYNSNGPDLGLIGNYINSIINNLTDTLNSIFNLTLQCGEQAKVLELLFYWHKSSKDELDAAINPSTIVELPYCFEWIFSNEEDTACNELAAAFEMPLETVRYLYSIHKRYPYYFKTILESFLTYDWTKPFSWTYILMTFGELYRQYGIDTYDPDDFKVLLGILLNHDWTEPLSLEPIAQIFGGLPHFDLQKHANQEELEPTIYRPAF